MATDNYPALKARVAKLGYELLTNDAGAQFVLDGTETVFIHRNEGDDEIEGWLAKRETNADTGRLYPTDTEDERLLNLIVLAKSRDRFRAMEIRKAQGVKAAIQFLGECTITDEPYYAETDEPTARDMLHDAWQTLFGIEKTAKMLYDTAGEDEAIGAARLIMISAEHAYTLIDEAKAKIEKDGAA